MRVHAGAVVSEERLRHERHAQAVCTRDVLDHVLVGHDLIRHPRERLEAQVDLALASRRDLVVVELTRDADPLQREHHLGSQIV
jgi:hypothetical protein